MREKFCCPYCGGENLQYVSETSTQTSGGGYSGGKGCLGFLLFGPLGLLCGACGQRQTTSTSTNTYWKCTHCGKTVHHPDDLRQRIAALEKSQPTLKPLMFIISIVLALVMYAVVTTAVELDSGIAFGVTILTFAASVFGGCITIRAQREERENLNKLLNQTLAGMKKFVPEVKTAKPEQKKPATPMPPYCENLPAGKKLPAWKQAELEKAEREMAERQQSEVEEAVAEEVNEKTTERVAFCPSCGAKQPGDWNFCPKCGFTFEKLRDME